MMMNLLLGWSVVVVLFGVMLLSWGVRVTIHTMTRITRHLLTLCSLCLLSLYPPPSIINA